MTAWWNGRAAPFDLESDGKDPQEARIITGCVAEVKPSVPAAVQNWMAKPERPIPQEAIDVHGITNERAEAEGHPREVVIEQIAAALAYGSAGEDGEWSLVPVVGHNLSYDFTLLDRELRRLGIGQLGVGPAGEGALEVVIQGQVVGAFYAIDTMIIDKAIDTYRPGPRDPVTGEKLGGRNKLGPTAEFYRVPIQGDAHNADADALAAARIGWAIARRADMAAARQKTWDTPWAEMPDGGLARHDEINRLYADRRRPGEVIDRLARVAALTLPELHAWQVRAARAQGASFKEYCIAHPEYVEETGIVIDEIRGDWPIRPLTDAGKVEDISTELV